MKLNVQWCIWAKIFEARLALIRGLVLSHMRSTQACVAQKDVVSNRFGQK